MGEQRIEGNGNVQIQGVVGSRIEITYNGDTRTVPLERAHVPVAKKLRSPARLIRAHASVVPYVERGDLTRELEAWIDSEAPFSGQVVGGRGGAGKTRLAVELCQRLQESHWLCGFLTRVADEGMLDALVDVPTPRLVVIDYAETRPEQLELLLPLLSARATQEHPVRALLLVRGASDGGGGWAERLANRVDALDAVLDECEARPLEDIPFGATERSSLYEAAVPALAERLDPGVEAAAPPDLAQKTFESPLMVVIAAYLAALGEVAPTTREGLLDEVLAHERRYWREDAEELGAKPVLLERVVAVAVLLNAASEAQAAECLWVLTDLHDATAERRNELARWVRAQYPGPRWWNPLEPDLVGEHLVAKCFTDQPDVLRGVLAAEDPEGITRPLEVLGRASADHPELARALGSILSEELERLCGVAVAQAEAVKDADLLYGRALTVAAAVDALLAVVQVSPEALRSALDLMPPRADLVMNDLATSLSAREVERLRPLAEANPAAHVADLARALNNLSVRLSDAGRHPEALAAIKESVAIRRPLAEANPAAYAPNLAIALNNLSNRLSDAGRHPEALEASEESVATWRPLAEANPAAHAPSLAIALNNLSNRLSDAGRHPEALEAIKESVAIRRPLAEANPAAHAPSLAVALNNLSLRLSDAGRHPEALEAIKESVATWRLLAEANPAAHAPNLAIALNNLSNRLSDAGRHPEALDAIKESVAIRRSLAEANPATHAADLAGALNNLSLRLSEAGRHSEALEASEESVATWRLLAEASPAAHAPNLAIALNNLSNRLSDAGRHPEALEASEESVATWRLLAEANPAAHAPHLAIALNNLSNRLSDAGRHPEALEAIKESVAIRRLLAEANPAAHAPDLTGALNNLSNRLAETGRHPEALEASEESVATWRLLAEANPAAHAPNLAIALNNLSNRLSEAGRAEEAEGARREAADLLGGLPDEDAA